MLEENNMSFEEHCKCFAGLTASSRIKKLLEKDKHFAIADNYHLSNVLLYFIRANFRKSDYNLKNFYLALYLSHDIYEDSVKARKYILRTYFGPKKNLHEDSVRRFFHARFTLLKKMNFNAYVDWKISKNLFKIIKSSCWNRYRTPLRPKITKTYHCYMCNVHFKT